MKKNALLVIISTLFTFTPQAIAVTTFSSEMNNKVALHLGGQIWQSEVSGNLGEENTPIELNKEPQINYFIAIEHIFPYLPNLQITNTTLDTTGKTNLTQEYSADNETSHVDINTDVDIDASFNASYIDYTLYYGLFDNGVFSFDLGLSARDFGGSYTVTEKSDTVTTTRDRIWDGAEHDEHDFHNMVETTNSVSSDKIKANKIIPMLYIASNMNMPLKGLKVFAQGDISLKENLTFSDYQVGLSYKLFHLRYNLSVQRFIADYKLVLGYRVVNMKLENLNALYTDLEFKGAFIGVQIKF